MGGGLVFFKQKTAYEVRISDWSSDVCSSDLSGRDEDAMRPKMKGRVAREARPSALLEIVRAMLRDAFVYALCHLARHEPLHHAIGDSRAHPLKDLDRSLVGYEIGRAHV